MKSTEIVTVRKLDPVSEREDFVSEEVPVEMPVTIYVNDELAVTLFATPNSQSELAIGHLIGEGILRDYSDIESIASSEETTTVRVRTKPKTRIRIEAAKMVRVLTSACGSSEDFYRLLDRIDKPLVQSRYRVSALEITRMMKDFNEHSNSRIGSLHYAAAYFEGEIKAFFEDVGRHNAVDKALGEVIKTGLDTSRTVLVGSGRQSAAEVMKAARVGIPVIVSAGGPIYSGIRAAEKTGVTLCCHARGPRMSVYSGFERVIFG